MSERVLYDLCGADPDVRFSPYCWRAKLALAHKGLSYEARPWRFTEREALAFSGQGRVPVLVDGGRTVADSFAIALHLEEAYPDAPSLFPGGVALARFVATWADTVLNAGLARMVVADILAALGPEDAAYFRETREARFGGRLEEIQAGREERLDAFRASLAPLRTALGEAPFLGGERPAYADYAVAGSFQWAHAVSAFDPLSPDDVVHGWRARMHELFDGLLDRAPRAVAA
ncbi:glutathione S-transferase family protein [Salinarimonas ramus]|uniref:Glutathione S-transferase n=1 Tax=Salinarimonas ramus TaxID=690164 RepID=A0A917QEC9_9HYPH|nr:glutathione S-transferase family protein [Salinarimonas ramus]GGK46539.1 glutathione S-transferase [Salinarimonas ramus]